MVIALLTVSLPKIIAAFEQWGMMDFFRNIGLVRLIENIKLEEAITAGLGHAGYQLIGVGFFALMGFVLFTLARRK